MWSVLLPILAVIIGFCIAFFLKAKANAIQLLLSYSGALLLAVTVFEFLPHVYQDYSESTGIMIMLGILVQIFLEFLSKGAEHGHLHHDKSQKTFPYLLFFSLCLHALIEGYPISENTHLLLGVVVHKIPIAIIITSFLFDSELSNRKISLFLFIFAIMTPLGSLFRLEFGWFANLDQYIDALVIGIFLHVSTTILFESSKNHTFNRSKMLAIILGMLTAFLLGHI